ncbi:MAG: DUF5110 domain-containing protein [Bacteroidales bacterium]|jgi:alpha-D-xyloside xylohydrolase|nr:DUF5110 domain-containing protein [Bacteroidales bacterium]
MKAYLISFFCSIILASCSQPGWEQTDRGVIVSLPGSGKNATKALSVEVEGANIFHVRATPEDSFSGAVSLCTVDDDRSEGFTVTETEGTLHLKTSMVSAEISLSSGRITFRDRINNILLREKENGAREFSPVTVEGTRAYSVRQVFESPDYEAFYGLGQHQSDEFNYKGLNESLYQYNTKVSIPFVVSDRNYGILWDNYSLTKFGDPRDYSEMDLFRLWDENGQEGGLTATYYVNSDPKRIFIKRKESVIDYENLTTIKKFPEKFPFYGSTITWTGQIEPAETGIFQFKLYYAGYTKLFIDDREVVAERWRTAWNPNTYKFFFDLEKGSRHTIRLEWKPDGGMSYIGLKALSPRPSEEQGELSLWSEVGDQIDYWFIAGDCMDDVISGYRTVTGKAPVMPKWAMGYWQSRERYKTQDELLSVVKEYRERNIPLDNIVLDWSYWPVDSWGSHDFDPKFFPDPEGMVDEVHRLNSHIMISVWPKFYLTTEHFREFDSRGWMYRQAIKDSIRDWIGKGYIGSFYDAYSEGARDLFWKQIHDKLYTKGFDAWWMDASEPDILSNASIEYRKQLMTPTALGPSAKYFNAYALMNAMTIYDNQRKADPDKRVFLLTRSGFAGLQRYSTATWSGDIGTRWEDMKAQIPAGLNFALSGIPYWTFDIGGFCVENRYTRAREGSEDLEEWRELNTRWFQFGSFCPLFRSHGQYPLREVFNISPEGHPAYNSMVYYDKLRYRLMPYIYSLAGFTYLKDYTIMRAMVMDFAGDQEVKNVGDQYMFGPSLLVAPVYKYKARTREVCLPSKCGWFDLYSGKYYPGGQRVTVDAPYERMPLFVKEGSVIPVGPEIQYADEKPADPLTLWVYTGRDCTFTLYEDEGVNYNYEKGKYSTIKFVYDNLNGELTICGRNGEFEGMLRERVFNIVWVSRDKPVPLNFNATVNDQVRYVGNEIIIRSKK